MKSLPEKLFLLMVVGALALTANLARAVDLSRACTVWYVGAKECHSIAEEAFDIASEAECVEKAKFATEMIGSTIPRGPSFGYFTTDMVLSCEVSKIQVEKVRYRYRSFQELRQ